MIGQENAPLTSVPATELAWLAGFFDGEGHMRLSINSWNSVNGLPVLVTQVNFTNTEKRNIDRAKAIVSAITGREARYVYRISYRGHKPRYDLKVSKHSEVKAVCEAMLPYASGKRPQIETMLQLLPILPTRKGKKAGISRIGPPHLALVQRMKVLNKRYAVGEWDAAARDQTVGSDDPSDEEMIRSAS